MGQGTGKYCVCLGNWGHTNLVRADSLCRYTKANGLVRFTVQSV